MTKAFPLHWPKGRSKTKSRGQSKFKVKPAQAYADMMDELRRFGATNVVISSNIPTRMDGSPYRDGLDQPLEDPGVTVWFTKRKRQFCFPCDSYRKPWENMRAIYIAIKGFRDMERHGATQIMDQAFSGFIALPAPDDISDAPDKAWWIVLGLDEPTKRRSEVEAAYKNACRSAGGAIVELNEAKETGLRQATAK